MRQITTALAPFGVIIALLSVPTSAAVFTFRNHVEQEKFEANLLKKHPEARPAFDEDATRIMDPKHPFWVRSTLVKTCPKTKEFLYTYKRHYYVGSRGEHGVVQLDDALTESDRKEFCS